MESKELYRHLLGINEPWTVERVDLDMTQGRVDVYVGHAKGVRFACPECGQEHPVYDHSAERVWRHLDSCQFMTYLHASPPRVSCTEHGVRQARLPWADEGSRFTHLFEALAVNVLLAANIERAAGLLRISWDQAWHLMERAVLRGRAAKGDALPKQIGVDEKAIAKGHQYMTLVCDLDQATVEYVGEGRREESLAAYFDAFGLARCAGIEAISLDMWPAFINACQEMLMMISTYPNPVSSFATLHYSLYDESSVSITIYDVLGRIAASPIVNAMESSGPHEALFNTNDLPSGLYSCRFSAGGFEEFVKIVVSH